MPRSFAQPATASPAPYSLCSDLWSVSFLPQGDSPAYFKVFLACHWALQALTGSYPLPELPLTFQAFLKLYFLALLSSELLVVVQIILLFLLHFSELDKCKCITIFIGILLLLNVIVRKNVPESMSSTK
ncbi:hypothetical protein K439DRAFT_1622107 [Ramaria rubella]|nr:hypothetical protein K439DRAFT_1622107 [Ramaria rubella]